MRRRDFIKFVAGSAAVWPLAARAQQPGKLPIIGYMGQGTPAAEAKRVTTLLGGYASFLGSKVAVLEMSTFDWREFTRPICPFGPIFCNAAPQPAAAAVRPLYDGLQYREPREVERRCT